MTLKLCRLDHWTLEAGLRARVGQTTETDQGLAAHFLATLSYILRKLRRSDRANSHVSMQSPVAGRLNYWAAKGFGRLMHRGLVSPPSNTL